MVATYAILGVAWIAFSDRALEYLFPDVHARDVAQTAKGAFFVAFTSALLYVLIRRSERALRALSAEVRATVDGMGDAVLLVDQRWRVVETNRAALQLLGVSKKDEILGPLVEWGRRFDVRAPDGTPLPIEQYATVRALHGETSAGHHALLRRRDGTDVFVSITASPVERPGARPLAVAVLRDVSSARRLDELRDEFLSTAAHEFKTPLAVIKAYAQLLQRREPAETQALAVIERQVERLNRLVQHLLDTTRLRLDLAEVPAERFDLGALAAEVLERMRPAAPSHQLRLAPPPPAPVLADRERIARVVTSLLDNAIRYSPNGGAVEARVERDGAQATFSVRDHGLGIPADRQARVFERYYRAHAGKPHDYGGLGLGLEMSREIVRRHGGRMWFESEDGVGSTFHFSLPVAGEAEP